MPNGWGGPSMGFLPTPSARRATQTGCHAGRPRRFLPTPSARRATAVHSRCLHHRRNFYPRPPRGGRRLSLRRAGRADCRFLPTPSARRATTMAALLPLSTTDFYPRPPRGGRRPTLTKVLASTAYFYPRPPRGGRRHVRTGRPVPRDFYPRPPRGGRQQMCHKIKAIFWQYLHNWIQPTKKQSVFV